MDLHDGLYDSLISQETNEALANKHTVEKEAVSAEELNRYLVQYLVDKLQANLEDISGAEQKLNFVNSILKDVADENQSLVGEQVLRGVLESPTADQTKIKIQPEIALSDLALLTNAKGDPSIGTELPKELLSADRVDILMAFVKVSGLRMFYEPLKALRGKVPVRLITTAYLGATDKKALDQLVNELGVEVKVDYLARANRLHAKAWLLKRNTGFNTAYVGSSNISNSAMSMGIEWNIRLSSVRSANVLDKISTTFDSYWASDIFEPYDPMLDGPKLEEALQRAKGFIDQDTPLTLSMLDVQPYPHQIQMLAEIEFERTEHDIHRNLVVAATGSGKTVLAALDFKRFYEQNPGKRLLFVAHRKEILKQSKATFAQVLKDSSFGELLVDGSVPQKWNHVFASIQSLTESRLNDFSPDHFDFVIIDEFHRASAPTYKRLMDHVSPIELLGLTATPEPTNGEKLQDIYFNGRIASELRLWDALDQELLTPFAYFGIGEETDFTGISWKSQGYDVAELSNLVTANTLRDRLVLQEIDRKVANLQEMKCLAFCVDIKHANYMAELLNKRGIPAFAVTSQTSSAERDEAIRDLRSGKVKVLTSVDVFNEGFDEPAINTVLMLRPTESPVIFLQQLGRGLRKAPGKTEVLVLDFIGAHRSQYRFDVKLSVLSGSLRGEIVRSVEDGFPYLPSGVTISLDALAREKVLANIRSQVAPGPGGLATEIQQINPSSLSDYLEKSGREIWELYRTPKSSWTDLKFRAGLADKPESANLPSVSKFTHVNDPERFAAYSRFMTEPLTPWWAASDRERRLRNMFFWHMWPEASDSKGTRWSSVDDAIASLASDTEFGNELVELMSLLDSQSRNPVTKTRFSKADVPLNTHANYSRYEIMGATGKAFLESSTFGYEMAGKSPNSISFSVEGVQYVSELEMDIFYVTLKKDERFSPSTRYRDYAESSTIFHWESQNKTSVSSPTGKRYLAQPETKHDVLICMRETSDGLGRASTFKLIGLADFMDHQGSSPIAIRWKLRTPLDLQTLKVASAVRIA